MVNSERRPLSLDARDSTEVQSEEHAGSTSVDPNGELASAPGRRRPCAKRLTMVAIAGIAIGGLIAFGIGFTHFVQTVADLEKPGKAERADAIVALTGGADRITDAIYLLGEGRARRLLISGVHPSTTRETLAGMAPGQADLFSCCVDLGHSALNTVGNAKEARDWARGNGFTSLIVVTSSYHLPRSLNEISREMPEADLIPYPVSTRRVQLDDWWHNPGTTRLLLSEYTKYLMSIARLRLGGPAISMEATHAAVGG